MDIYVIITLLERVMMIIVSRSSAGVKFIPGILGTIEDIVFDIIIMDYLALRKLLIL